MSQGTIHRLRSGGETVGRIQADLGGETPDVLCAPVVARTARGALVPKLHLEIIVDDTPCVILMSQLVALPAMEPGAAAGSAADRRDANIAVVDLLVSGY